MPYNDPGKNAALTTDAMAADIDTLKAQLQAVLTTCRKEYSDNPGRLEQLTAHIETAAMCVDALATETPYRINLTGV